MAMIIRWKKLGLALVLILSLVGCGEESNQIQVSSDGTLSGTNGVTDPGPAAAPIEKFLGVWEFTEVSEQSDGSCSSPLKITLELIDGEILRISKRNYRCGNSTTGISTKDLVVSSDGSTTRLLYGGRSYGGVFEESLNYNLSSGGCLASLKLAFYPADNYVELKESFGCTKYGIPNQYYTSRAPLVPVGN